MPTEEADDAMASQARKRRMERRAKQHPPSSSEVDDAVVDLVDDHIHEDDQDEASVVASTTSSPRTSTSSPQRKKAKLSVDALARIPGVKKQARYVPAVDPGVKMTKEELTLWRKEARRVRNRESAAASRQKTQGRITELEGQVATLTSKYQAALAHIAKLEAAAASASASSSCQACSCGGGPSSEAAWMPAKMSLHRAAEAAAAHPVSPPLSPRDSSSSSRGSHNPQEDDDDQDHLQDAFSHFSYQDAPLSLSSVSSRSAPPPTPHHPSTTTNTTTNKYQQRPPKISRPNACVQNPLSRAAVVIAT